MSYNKFTLEKLVDTFDIKTEVWNNVYENVESKQPSQFLNEMLLESVPMAVAIHTEKARSELIIMPILFELKKLANKNISIFSGKNLDIDTNLKGAVDFIISKSAEQHIIKEPIATIVEAKREDIEGYVGQCGAEMIGAQKFNEKKNKNLPVIYGAITTGNHWKFLKLIDKTLYIEPLDTSIEHIDKILGLLYKISTT